MKESINNNADLNIDIGAPKDTAHETDEKSELLIRTMADLDDRMQKKLDEIDELSDIPGSGRQIIQLQQKYDDLKDEHTALSQELAEHIASLH